MRLAILTRSDFKSPRFLAESLKHQLTKAGATADIFFEIDHLTRLNNLWKFGSNIKLHFWLRKKLKNYFADRIALKKLKEYDAIIVSECAPNGFWSDLYQIEKLRRVVGKPVLYYEVYYLGNAPTQVAALKQNGHPLTERYNWHLAVADVTEVKNKVAAPWSCIGLDLSASGLEPKTKDEFVALVDFPQPGYEQYRQDQLTALQELNIKTIVLNGSYTFEEIKELYKRASVYFMQSPEAFGLPIAECFATGAYVFTADTSWPMSWRLNEKPKVHGPGTLPDIFHVYSSKEDLKSRLLMVKEEYDLEQTPYSVFQAFVHHYPHYYYGNPREIKDVLKRVEGNTFS